MTMNRRTALKVVALKIAAGAIMIGALGACTKRLPTFHYRLSLEVETPQGVRTGSSVIEVRTVERGKRFLGPKAGRLHHGVSGEAVAVDLPGGQTLFALLREGGPEAFNFPEATPFRAYAPLGVPDSAEYALRHQALVESKGVRVLKRPYYPTLVRFRDIHDPKSVEQVNPDDLAASFGAGVKIRRITVQITDDPVTTGIERRFLWWGKYRNRYFDGSSTASENLTKNSLAGHIFSASFRS